MTATDQEVHIERKRRPTETKDGEEEGWHGRGTQQGTNKRRKQTTHQEQAASGARGLYGKEQVAKAKTNLKAVLGRSPV